MPEHPHLIDELYNSISRDGRTALLYEAGVPPEPSALDALGRELWREQNRERLLTALLRRVNFTDAQVARCWNDGDFPTGNLARVAVSAKIGRARRSATEKMRVPEVALAAGILTAIAGEVAGALRPLAIEDAAPMASLRGGSIHFSLATTPVATGVGVALYHLAGVPESIAIGTGAVILALSGVIDMALTWEKRDAEIQKLRAEAANLLEHARKARCQTKPEDPDKSPGGGGGGAASALVSQAEVHAQARRLGISEPLAHHILNRALPAAIEARKLMPIEVKFGMGQAA
jgi:hypothetical protein